MTPPTLRKYQKRLQDQVRVELRTHQCVLLQSPTGSGKTLLTASMIGTAAKREMRSWFTVHRIELVRQTSDALWLSGVPHGKIAANHPETTDIVQVATIQSLIRRLGRLPKPRFIIIDEAHRAVSASYRKLIEACPDAFVVGLTATPCRTDGRGLDDIFQALVTGPTVTDLTRAGYLSPYRIVAPGKPVDTSEIHTRGGDWAKDELEVLVDQSSIIGSAVAHYQRYVFPGTCLVYCVSRLHARHVTEVYRQSGINAVYVAGDTTKSDREQAIEGFRTGQPPVIVSVDLFGEGLDVPGLNAVQLLRPTQSLGLFLQQVGRGLRVEEGKRHLVILDHVGNSWRHGLPDDAREWTLEGRKRGKGKVEPGAIALRHCSKCFSIFPAVCSACPNCGAEYLIRGRLPEEEDGELQEIEAEEHRRARKQSRREEGIAGGESLEALVALGVERGYKPGWAVMRWALQQGIRRGTPEYKQLFGKARGLAKEMVG